MFHSIRWRIALPFLLSTLAVIWGLGLYSAHLLEKNLLESTRCLLLAQAQMVSDLSLPYIRDDREKLQPLAEEWAEEIVAAPVTIISRDGRVLADLLHESKAAQSPEVEKALRGTAGSDIRFSPFFDDEAIFVAVPITDRGSVLGVARLAFPLSRINPQLRELRGAVLLASGVASLLALFLSLLIAGLIAHPIKELTRAARRIARGDFGQRAKVKSKDEVGDLAFAFNRMAERIEETLKLVLTERDKMAAIVNNLESGVIITDAGGRVKLMNPAAQRLFETSGTEAQERPFIEISQDHQMSEILSRVLKEGREYSEILEKFDQGKKFLRIFASPLGEGALVIIQDLTEIRRLETIRRDFITNISHELRAPLASIRVLAESLEEGALNEPEVASSFLHKIQVEVDKLSQLVSELNELSRIESGDVHFDMKPVNVGEVVRRACERMEPMAERAGLSLTFEFPPELPPVLADEARIEQVLVNLLHNAVKFTPPGGKVSVLVKAEEGGLSVSVADTGVGIPKEELPRIFERFYKVDKARSGGGTGLGLAIAKHIVKAHGGKIWAESEEKKGSVFAFTLPIASS